MVAPLFQPHPPAPSPRLQGRGARWAETIHELEKRRVLPAQTRDLSHSVSAKSLLEALGSVDTDRREGFRVGLAVPLRGRVVGGVMGYLA